MRVAFRVAELYGRSITERVEALIGIAEPRFQSELQRAVREVERDVRSPPPPARKRAVTSTK